MRPQSPITAKGRLDITFPKLAIPRKVLPSANKWYDCGCGIRGIAKQSKTMIAVNIINFTNLDRLGSSCGIEAFCVEDMG